uniref:Uncharacterized protein n=1 Tax=Avena sativa TaxID=4498 RepID=A0ACD5ZMD4_AVESA
MAMASTKHVVLFPFPGQGHLVSFLEAARLLRCVLPGDVSITLVSTPRNVAALRASASASSPSSLDISFHALPFLPADHGLPADCESTSSIPPPAYLMLFEAFESLEPAFDAYISSLAAECGSVCVIADVFVAWTVGVARRRGCAHAVFVSCGAFGTAILHDLWKNMPALPFGDDGLLRLPAFPEVELHRSQMSQVFLSSPSLGMDRLIAFHDRQTQHGYLTDAVLMNTVQELEPTGLAIVRRTLGKQVPVCSIGPLVGDGSAGTATDDGVAVMRWLDSQPPSSVLYISFGSQNSIRRKQMMELATALESTGRPFVWAFRPPVGLHPNIDGVEEWLPAGFEARARAANRGLLVHGWAPQVSILAHASTGAFLSHCGWNSVLESLTHGVPIVGWPLSAEQFYNVKTLAEEWGVCVEVARGNLESSTVESCKVAQVVETAMGAEMRQRAAAVKEVLKKAWAEDGGSSRTALQEFLGVVRLH